MPRNALHSRIVPLALAALALFGCGQKSGTTLLAQLPPPPEVAATTPAARSTGVAYDTPIVLDFAAALDPSTVNASNVFLKLDTRRLTIAVSWNAAARRLTVVPATLLDLRKTYTVELGPGLHTADGVGLTGDGWFFQFTTNSARFPTTPRPAPGTANESPFVMLSWDSTEAAAGPITYQVFAGIDSAAVAARASIPLATLARASWIPGTHWPLGQDVYWAITVVNAATGEHLRGAVQKFTTISPSTPVDSLTVTTFDTGYNYLNFGLSSTYPYQFCSSDSMVGQPGYQCWLTPDLSALPADVHVAGAHLDVSTYDYNIPRLPGTTVFAWSDKYRWIHPCKSSLNYTTDLPQRDELMGTGVPAGGPVMRFDSDKLAAHLEASVRRGGYFGYELIASQRMSFVTQRGIDPTRRPVLKIYYFRTSAPTAARLAP